MAGSNTRTRILVLGANGQVGHALHGVLAPLGEVVVATLGVIYNLGEAQDENSADLRQTLADATWEGTGRKVFNLPVALSIMVFFALCAQCVSTLAVIRRETGTWAWPAFTFAYMTALAYVGALVTYQVGIRFWG